jgi:CheY-like chemotaxis protein
MLSVILGYTELILDKLSPTGDHYDELQEILKAAQRSMAVTRQLLAFARKQTIAPVIIDLNRTVEGMLKMLRRLIGENISLTWIPGDTLWPVKMDPTQIDQILANLFVNAKDAIGDVGKITIETGRKTFTREYCNDHPGFIPGDFVLLAVSDNGCGMSKDVQIRLFEPFFTTKEEGKGTGLGLATIYGIVKQNNGFINVYSEPEKGTTFRIYFPSHASETSKVRQAGREKIKRGNGEVVLIVEDEVSILNLGKTMLQKLGYTVLAASSVQAAIHIAETYPNPIHLLITDVVLPEMKGLDLSEIIKKLSPDIRILFMSGYTANVIADHGILYDGVHFIQKPFSHAELSVKIREVLDGEPPVSPA